MFCKTFRVISSICYKMSVCNLAKNKTSSLTCITFSNDSIVTDPEKRHELKHFLFKLPLDNVRCISRALRSNGTKQDIHALISNLDWTVYLNIFFREIFLKLHYSFTTKFSSKLNLTILHIYMYITEMNIIELQNLHIYT